MIVTHNLAQTKRIADDVAFFQNGRLVETKDAETFIRSVQLFVWMETRWPV